MTWQNYKMNCAKTAARYTRSKSDLTKIATNELTKRAIFDYVRPIPQVVYFGEFLYHGPCEKVF